MIQLKNVEKKIDDKHILKNISLTLPRGQTNLIIGQSGAGKTVLLKTIIGLHEPTSGEVYYDNINFFKINQQQRKKIRKKIGMVFQGGALFDSETVLENVIFPLRMFSQMTYAEMKERAEYSLNRVNLYNIKGLYPSETSGGMQKRIAIARAIVLQPKYLFFDEPNSGLDPNTAITIDNLIKELTQELNTVTVINTHDMNSVIEIGDNIHFIYKGEKWWSGNKQELLKTTNPELTNFIFASKLMKNIK